MKTYKQFIKENFDILERYYRPDEKLPSGRTPEQKAEDRAERPYENTRGARGRQIRQKFQLKRKVRHGADNPNLNLHRQDGIDVTGDRDSAQILDKRSNIRYSVRKTGRTKSDNKPVYDVSWDHGHHPSAMSQRQKIEVTRDAKDVWNSQVQHRLPRGSVLRNSPVPNPTKENPNKNTRARMYKKAGFGEVGEKGQFARVGREPSTKQKRKGKTRLSPLPPTTDYEYGED